LPSSDLVSFSLPSEDLESEGRLPNMSVIIEINFHIIIEWTILTKHNK
jgi:hypothetical protein